MSVPNQPNGKKSASSSLVNTPSSTPVTSSNGNTPAVTVIHNSPPPNNNAPKYGTLVPNRIFVGGISANTTEGELLQLFSTYGTVKAAKIIQDRAGVSKGYGFITFESEDDAQRPLREADNIVLRERKLNIAPAVKKQLSFPQPFNFNRAFDGASPTTVTVANPSFFLPPIPYYQNSMSYYGPPAPNPPVPGDPNAQQPVYQPPPPVYSAQTGPPQAATFPPSVMYPQPFYIQQQYPLMPYADYTYFSNNGAPAQYVVGAQGGPGPQGPPLPPSGSPPRPPCFNQQVAYANEPVYYNVSMYQPMDHPAAAVFQEPIDANGNYSERPNSVQSAIAVDVMYNSQAGTEFVERPRLLLPSVSPFDAAATRFTTTTPPYISQPPPTAPKQPQRETEETARQTATPEVSLLSIDNSCERDLNSMQGGRRRPAPPTITPSSAYHPIPNGLPPLAVSLANTSVPPPSHFRYQQPPFYSHVPVRPYNGQGPQFAPRQQQLARSAQANNSWPRRQQQRKTYGNRQHQPNNNNSTRSSVRTESTSSLASFIEDNRNNQRTNVNTPPPAPYSPLTNHGYAPRFNGTTTPPVDNAPARQNRNYNLNGQPDNRRFYNNRNSNYNNKQNGSNYRATNNVRQNGYNGFVNSNNRRGAFRQTELTNNGHQNNRFRTEANRTVAALPENDHRVETNESELTDCSDRVDIKPENEKTDDTNAPQVHGASGTSSYAPLPIRRSKRSIRRSNAGAGNALSEIGAGDAPLPTQTSESVAEACKKLDGLKL